MDEKWGILFDTVRGWRESLKELGDKVAQLYANNPLVIKKLGGKDKDKDKDEGNG